MRGFIIALCLLACAIMAVPAEAGGFGFGFGQRAVVVQRQFVRPRVQVQFVQPQRFRQQRVFVQQNHGQQVFILDNHGRLRRVR